MPVDFTINAVDSLHQCTRDWFRQAFRTPTRVQSDAWPVLAARKNALLLAPTGSGKTLAAFLTSIDRLFFENDDDTPPDAEPQRGIRVVYISPLKALGVDVDRNLRAPIAGLRAFAGERAGFASGSHSCCSFRRYHSERTRTNSTRSPRHPDHHS